MKIYSVGSRLIFLISLLFLGGSQLFAATEQDDPVEQLAELNDTVEMAKIKLRKANTELSKNQEDIKLKEKYRLAEEELEEAKLALRMAQREANKKRSSEVKKPVGKQEEQEKREKAAVVKPVQARPRGQGKAATPEAKPTGAPQKPMDSKEVKDAVRAAALKELADLKKEAVETGLGWERVSNRAGFFIEEAKKVGDKLFEARAKVYKEEADKLLPRTIWKDMSRAAAYATGPVTSLLSGASSLATKGAGTVSAAAQKASEAASSVWRYFGGSSKKI